GGAQARGPPARGRRARSRPPPARPLAEGRAPGQGVEHRGGGGEGQRAGGLVGAAEGRSAGRGVRRTGPLSPDRITRVIRIYLVRHGIAVEPSASGGLPDDDRPLTAKG